MEVKYISRANCSTSKTPVRVVEANNSYGHEPTLRPQQTLLAAVFHNSTGKHMRVFCSYNFPPATEEAD